MNITHGEVRGPWRWRATELSCSVLLISATTISACDTQLPPPLVAPGLAPSESVVPGAEVASSNSEAAVVDCRIGSMSFVRIEAGDWVWNTHTHMKPEVEHGQTAFYFQTSELLNRHLVELGLLATADCMDCPVEFSTWTQAAEMLDVIAREFGREPCYSEVLDDLRDPLPGIHGWPAVPLSTWDWTCIGPRMPTMQEVMRVREAAGVDRRCDLLDNRGEVTEEHIGCLQTFVSPPSGFDVPSPTPHDDDLFGLANLVGGVPEWTQSVLSAVVPGRGAEVYAMLAVIHSWLDPRIHNGWSNMSHIRRGSYIERPFGVTSVSAGTRIVFTDESLCER